MNFRAYLVTRSEKTIEKKNQHPVTFFNFAP